MLSRQSWRGVLADNYSGMHEQRWTGLEDGSWGSYTSSVLTSQFRPVQISFHSCKDNASVSFVTT